MKISRKLKMKSGILSQYQKEFEILIDELRALPQESEWVEFKVDNTNPQIIGEYVSALSNSANLENREYAYLVFGIEDNPIKLSGLPLTPRKKNKRVFREEVRMYPELAVRELIANAIIHQDFNIKGTSAMIEIFENRIEFTNPGKPLIDTKRFIDHSPESRNEMLASLMRRMNFCEERGSGIDKVIHEIDFFLFIRIILLYKLLWYESIKRINYYDNINTCGLFARH